MMSARYTTIDDMCTMEGTRSRVDVILGTAHLAFYRQHVLLTKLPKYCNLQYPNVAALWRVISLFEYATGCCVWSKSELARQTCSERPDRGGKQTDGECQTKPQSSKFSYACQHGLDV